MHQVSLSPTGLDTLEFTGDLLISVEGNDQDSRTGGRWHNISVYQTDTGSLATCIAYQTTAADEAGHCQVEMAQDVSDVDSILSLYDPKQHLVMEPGHGFNRVAEAVIRQYDTQVNEVLDFLHSSSPAQAPAKPR